MEREAAIESCSIRVITRKFLTCTVMYRDERKNNLIDFSAAEDPAPAVLGTYKCFSLPSARCWGVKIQRGPLDLSPTSCSWQTSRANIALSLEPHPAPLLGRWIQSSVLGHCGSGSGQRGWDSVPGCFAVLLSALRLQFRYISSNSSRCWKVLKGRNVLCSPKRPYWLHVCDSHAVKGFIEFKNNAHRVNH